MNLNEAKYLIVDHFDSIKNQIDINIETLLCEPGLNEEDRKGLNEMREQQLEKLKEFQQTSLSQLNTLSETDFESEFTQVINDSTLVLDQKIDRILRRFILNDLILIENSKLKHKQALCAVSGYLNKKNENIKYKLTLF